MNQMGHCLSYKTTNEIETAQAVKAQLTKESGSLPLISTDYNFPIPTVFWVDNFDIKIDRQVGSNCVNTTHLVAFQEETDFTERLEIDISVERNSKLTLENKKQTVNLKFNAKAEPTLLEPEMTEPDSSIAGIKSMYFLWMWTRKENNFDQLVPMFSGFLLNQREKEDLKKTIVTYLPPIASKVNEFETIIQYMEYLQRLAAEVNMKYVNITLDVGAAINAYKTIWSHPDKFGNVIIHLGDFHFIKENFLVRFFCSLTKNPFNL